MYQKQIEQLVVLQEIDGEIIVLQKEVDQAPRELAQLEATHDEIMGRKNQIIEKVDIIKQQQGRLGVEIEDDSVKIKKSKSKLMMASNTREYHAMMREMDNMEKLNRLREEEDSAMSEELGRLAEQLEEVEVELTQVNEKLDIMREGLEERVKKANKRLDTLNKKRVTAGKVVPKPILARYEFIRERLAAPVIVSVAKGVCAGCNIAIPPQVYNELQQGQQIHSCPNCKRLIYWDEHLPEEAAKNGK